MESHPEILPGKESDGGRTLVRNDQSAPSQSCLLPPAALVDQRPHKKPDIQTELLNTLDHVHAGRTAVIISDQIATI